MAKKGPKQKRKSTRGPRRSAQAVVPWANVREQNHVRMIIDPCNAQLGPTAYRGKDGFITRFNNAYGVSDVTATCCVVAYWPRMNRCFVFPVVSTSFAFAMDFWNATFSFPGPGAPFLGTNAGETRPVAACITSQFTGTEFDRQGLVVEGVIPNRVTTGTLTIDALCTQLQQWGRTPDGMVETKWIPSPNNEEYQQIPGAGPPTVLADDNIIVQVYRGFTAGKLLVSARVTAVQEWQPYYGLGITVPTPNTQDPPAGLERVRTTLASFGHWWLGLGNTAHAAAAAANRIAAGTRLMAGAARAAAPLVGFGRVAPMLLAA